MPGAGQCNCVQWDKHLNFARKPPHPPHKPVPVPTAIPVQTLMEPPPPNTGPRSTLRSHERHGPGHQLYSRLTGIMEPAPRLSPPPSSVAWSPAGLS